MPMQNQNMLLVQVAIERLIDLEGDETWRSSAMAMARK